MLRRLALALDGRARVADEAGAAEVRDERSLGLGLLLQASVTAARLWIEAHARPRWPRVMRRRLVWTGFV